MNTYQLTEQEVKDFHKTGNYFTKKLLENKWGKHLFLELPKTLEEVELIWGKIKIPYPHTYAKNEKVVNAFVKLQVIAEVLNASWKPDFLDSNELKYYPVFIHTTDTFKVNNICYDLVLSHHVIYFKTSELALHAATYFTDIYKDLLD